MSEKKSSQKTEQKQAPLRIKDCNTVGEFLDFVAAHYDTSAKLPSLVKNNFHSLGLRKKPVQIVSIEEEE